MRMLRVLYGAHLWREESRDLSRNPTLGFQAHRQTIWLVGFLFLRLTNYG